VHFGLLKREGNVYRLAELANQIFVYLNEDEKQAAILTAFRKPTLYTKLITEYDGKALPKMLDNILVRNHSITERVAKDAAAAFVKSAEFAGVLTNGVLNTSQIAPAEKSEGDTGASESAYEEATSPAQPEGVQPPAASVQPTTNNLPVQIPGTDVIILFPLEYAYDLSVGTFKPGIELLAKNISQRGSANDGGESTTPAAV
jgi:hypothetical protein